MFIPTNWIDYELMDAGNGQKLERWGDIVLLRPEPQAAWPMKAPSCLHARYLRSASGGGHWKYETQLPDSWPIQYQDLTFIVRPTGFKHTGLFPEQAANWLWMRDIVSQSKQPLRVLNLFAYTGGASCALAAAGAHVTHVDAAKGMVLWAKENRELTGLPEESTRFIVEDAKAFVRRELRRGNHYDGILMDPPSYGRGPGGEVWKLEDELYGLVDLCAEVLSDTPLFFLINGYTTGFSACVLRNIAERCLCGRYGGKVEASELALKVSTGGVLPCGTTARWIPDA